MADARAWVDEYFKGRYCGRFLEIGAYDGVSASVTAGLIARGWRGVMVEPHPEVFRKLLVNRGDNPDLRLVHAAITATPILTPFWESMMPDGSPAQSNTIVAGFRPSQVNRGLRYRKPYTIATCGVAQLLYAFGGPLHWRLVVVDAEGATLDIMQAMPLSEMTDTEVIVVEARSETDARAMAGDYYEVAKFELPDAMLTRKPCATSNT